MVGQSALAACRADGRVSEVTAIVRTPLGIAGGNVREVVCPDLFQIESVMAQLGTPDACLFCAGVSAVGHTEAEYRRITYDMTLTVANALVQLSPAMRFLYVTGTGTDSSERGRQMWARVKGATENALLRLGFAAVVLFRPGYIQPLGGLRSKVGWYNTFYTVLRPVYPLLKLVGANYVTDSETLGRAMLAAVQPGGPSGVIESAGINRLGAARA
jgi:uncharacterized protein YbjT (DUF2867 family)